MASTLTLNSPTGHNLNLHHAGEGTSAYGDQSGLMVSRVFQPFFVFLSNSSLIVLAGILLRYRREP
jgi:hypothetical protein